MIAGEQRDLEHVDESVRLRATTLREHKELLHLNLSANKVKHVVVVVVVVPRRRRPRHRRTALSSSPSRRARRVASRRGSGAA